MLECAKNVEKTMSVLYEYHIEKKRVNVKKRAMQGKEVEEVCSVGLRDGKIYRDDLRILCADGDITYEYRIGCVLVGKIGCLGSV